MRTVVAFSVIATADIAITIGVIGVVNVFVTISTLLLLIMIMILMKIAGGVFHLI